MCDLNLWIGVNARVVVARFARRHLRGICAVGSVGSQCVVARFARRHLRGICAVVSVGSQCVVARFARRHYLWGICAAISVGSQCVVARFAKALRSHVVRSTTLFVNPRYPTKTVSRKLQSRTRAQFVSLILCRRYTGEQSIFPSGLDDSTTFVLLNVLAPIVFFTDDKFPNVLDSLDLARQGFVAI